MSEPRSPTPAAAANPSSTPTQNSTPKQPQKRGPSVHQIYALPAPIRTFPLPTFYPNNPISLVHFGWAWLKQTWRPPAAEPSVVHHGVWSDASCSVHITDEKSMRALWEQGFYGKGNLSRSEPHWLKRELVRKGTNDSFVSEILTNKRREERAEAKWERARLEQEAIRLTKLEEAEKAQQRLRSNIATKPTRVLNGPPVGPLELLALPNSEEELADIIAASTKHAATNGLTNGDAPRGLSLIEQLVSDEEQPTVDREDGIVSRTEIPVDLKVPIETEARAASVTSESSSNASGDKSLKRQKSVRFSPTVESATFKLSDPPSPSAAVAAIVKAANEIQLNGNAKTTNEIPPEAVAELDALGIVNREHLQLTPEESFFLAFGFGTLTVSDSYSGQLISNKELLRLFRQHSYSPPRTGPDDDLQPDDNFLVHYAVYHHFRSLGWVPRPGIKFAVDWLLYTRGPVFDHAEFGLIVIPSYSDPWWKEHGTPRERRSWSWMHSVVRVLSHATKSLVLVYVDVPPPAKFEKALDVSVSSALGLYKVREILVKRWSSNRNR